MICNLLFCFVKIKIVIISKMEGEAKGTQYEYISYDLVSIDSN